MATVIYGDFEWNDTKAHSNLAKHGISFEEATTVFLDLDYMLVPDASCTDRLLALGFCNQARLLLVVHIERGERVRIISARQATKTERAIYDQRHSRQ